MYMKYISTTQALVAQIIHIDTHQWRIPPRHQESWWSTAECQCRSQLPNHLEPIQNMVLKQVYIQWKIVIKTISGDYMMLSLKTVSLVKNSVLNLDF